ncbi:MAG: hypothetical protein ACRER2_16115 [Methylococcales bacterium]
MSRVNKKRIDSVLGIDRLAPLVKRDFAGGNHIVQSFALVGQAFFKGLAGLGLETFPVFRAVPPASQNLICDA